MNVFDGDYKVFFSTFLQIVFTTETTAQKVIMGNLWQICWDM